MYEYEEFPQEEAKLFLQTLQLEHEGIDIPGDELPFLCQVVQTRIKAMKLPIEFTKPALFAICCFTDIPGGAVVFLIDALNQFEGKTVTAAMLGDLYPWGFYTEESLFKYIDGEIKTRTKKWSEVY